MAPPTDTVIEMKKRGLSNREIIKELSADFRKEEIAEAINQAELKQNIEVPELPEIPRPISREARSYKEPSYSPVPELEESFIEEPPSPSQYPYESYPVPTPTNQTSNIIPPMSPLSMEPSFSQESEITRGSIERIQEISESIIQEKWVDFMAKIGDIQLWKSKVDTNITSIKQEVLRTNQRIQNLEKSILSRTREYQKTMEDVSVEMKTLEKVFEKIINPLTSNIKELSRITNELKKKT